MYSRSPHLTPLHPHRVTRLALPQAPTDLQTVYPLRLAQTTDMESYALDVCSRLALVCSGLTLARTCPERE